jgi:tRNA(Met) cytidine acetyltransferase
MVLAGGCDWCRQSAKDLLFDTQRPRLWVGEGMNGIECIPAAAAAQWLGRELDLLVYDAWSGFDVDAFGAISGTLRGGGLLLLLTPPLEQWPDFNDPNNARIAVYPYSGEQVGGGFFRRLAGVIRAAKGVSLIEQGAALPAVPYAGSAKEPGLVDAICRTTDQQQAVEAILKVVSGHRRRPLVLTSDRGRGKSAALGIAAAQLLQQGHRRILVTAPRLDAVQPLFAHAAALLPGATVSRAGVHWGEGHIEFAPPDALARQPQAAELLLIDEAAAIPAQLLEQLLRHHARLVFATTVHGYEGTGRGFAVRFHQVLDAQAPGWRALRMEQPIRWASNDPLERLVFRALLLSAEPAPEQALAGARMETAEIAWLERDALAADEVTLSELFGLLVLAHYRTAPSDLRHLLDSPDVSVVVMRHNGHVAATALLAAEGGIDAAMAQAIWAGTRRPRGHLIPQSLAAHLGLEQAPLLHGQRVMRIAVHPALQGLGLGSRLLGALGERAREQGLDFLGASFGISAPLLRFWQRAGMVPLRIGVSRDHSSGSHSLIVLRALSDRGEQQLDEARMRFHRQLPYLLAEPLQPLEAALACELLRDDPASPPALTEWEWRELSGFAGANRGYDFTLRPLWELTVAALADRHATTHLSAGECALLVMKVVQHRPWAEVARASGLAGRGEVLAVLKGAVCKLLDHYRRTGVAG